MHAPVHIYPAPKRPHPVRGGAADDEDRVYRSCRPTDNTTDNTTDDDSCFTVVGCAYGSDSFVSENVGNYFREKTPREIRKKKKRKKVTSETQKIKKFTPSN